MCLIPGPGPLKRVRLYTHFLRYLVSARVSASEPREIGVLFTAVKRFRAERRTKEIDFGRAAGPAMAPLDCLSALRTQKTVGNGERSECRRREGCFTGPRAVSCFLKLSVANLRVVLASKYQIDILFIPAHPVVMSAIRTIVRATKAYLRLSWLSPPRPWRVCRPMITLVSVDGTDTKMSFGWVSTSKSPNLNSCAIYSQPVDRTGWCVFVCFDHPLLQLE